MKSKYFIVKTYGKNAEAFGGNPSYVCKVSGIQFYSKDRMYAALFRKEKDAQKLADALARIPWCFGAEVESYTTEPLGDVL